MADGKESGSDTLKALAVEFAGLLEPIALVQTPETFGAFIVSVVLDTRHGLNRQVHGPAQHLMDAANPVAGIPHPAEIMGVADGSRPVVGRGDEVPGRVDFQR